MKERLCIPTTVAGTETDRQSGTERRTHCAPPPLWALPALVLDGAAGGTEGHKGQLRSVFETSWESNNYFKIESTSKGDNKKVMETLQTHTRLRTARAALAGEEPGAHFEAGLGPTPFTPYTCLCRRERGGCGGSRLAPSRSGARLSVQCRTALCRAWAARPRVSVLTSGHEPLLSLGGRADGYSPALGNEEASWGVQLLPRQAPH